MTATAVCLLVFLAVHYADQVSDSATALIYFSQGFLVEGCLTLTLVFLPGVLVFLLETRLSLLGRGNILRGLMYMFFCPLYTWTIILYSLHHREWRDKAMFLVTLQGLLSSSPQLILQLSLWSAGVLTQPAAAVLDLLPANVTSSSVSAVHSGTTNKSFEFLGRVYGEESSYIFGLVQLISILLSFLSVLASGIYFNETETRTSQISALYRKCTGIPFLLTTVLFRAISLALVVCFLQEWSLVVLFIFFFLTVLVSVCGGDRFPRAVLYGIWSLLIPVGFFRDPLESLGNKVLFQYSIADSCENQSSNLFLKQRAKYFVNTHLIISTVLIFPVLIVCTVLVNQATDISWIQINTDFIFTLHWLNLVIVPVTGLLLALSILLGRLYLHLVCNQLKTVQTLAEIVKI